MSDVTRVTTGEFQRIIDEVDSLAEQVKDLALNLALYLARARAGSGGGTVNRLEPQFIRLVNGTVRVVRELIRRGATTPIISKSVSSSLSTSAPMSLRRSPSTVLAGAELPAADLPGNKATVAGQLTGKLADNCDRRRVLPGGRIKAKKQDNGDAGTRTEQPTGST